VPHYGTLSRRQKAPTVVVPRRPRGEPPHLVVDSTGLKVPGEGEWKARRRGADRRRAWREVRLALDADGHEIRAVEMTDHRHGGGEILPDLPAQVPEGEEIASLGGDGACDTRTAHEAAAARAAALLVPPRRNGRPWQTRTGGAEARNEALRAVRHLGRRPWKRWSGHRRRSLAEAAMSRLERPGERLAARDPDGQVAEVQLRRAILDIYNRLGMPIAVAAA
jgi:DDE family transposase